MILVTGSSGFVGSALIDALGDTAIGLQRSSAPGIKGIIKCDLTDIHQVEGVIKQLMGRKITHLIHTAATTPWSHEPDFSLDIKMAKSIRLLCEGLEIPQLISISGWNVYDMTGIAPYDEETMVGPVDEYGKSKKTVEDYFVRNLVNTHILNLRFASIYGVGQLSTGLIPNLVSSAIQNNHITLNALITKRDYIYIADCIEAIKMLIKMNYSSSSELNLGSGRSITILEVAETIQNIYKEKYGITVNIERPENPREATPIDNQLDIKKAQQVGILQHAASFSDGVARYIEWRRNENIL